MNPIKMAGDFTTWFTSEITADFSNGPGSFWTQITLPLLDRHNDHIQVCVAFDEENAEYVLTDDGESATEIGLTDWALDDPRFMSGLGDICRAYDVFLADNEVQTKCATEAELPERINALAQAQLAIGGLWILAPVAASSLGSDQ